MNIKHCLLIFFEQNEGSEIVKNKFQNFYQLLNEPSKNRASLVEFIQSLDDIDSMEPSELEDFCVFRRSIEFIESNFVFETGLDRQMIAYFRFLLSTPWPVHTKIFLSFEDWFIKATKERHLLVCLCESGITAKREPFLCDIEISAKLEPYKKALYKELDAFCHHNNLTENLFDRIFVFENEVLRELKLTEREEFLLKLAILKRFDLISQLPDADVDEEREYIDNKSLCFLQELKNFYMCLGILQKQLDRNNYLLATSVQEDYLDQIRLLCEEHLHKYNFLDEN